MNHSSSFKSLFENEELFKLCQYMYNHFNLDFPALLFILCMHLIIVQVDKLKVLSESLASSASQAETRILDNRFVFFTVYITWTFLSFECKHIDNIILQDISEKDLHS